MEDPFARSPPTASLLQPSRLRPAPPPPSFPGLGAVCLALQRTFADECLPRRKRYADASLRFTVFASEEVPGRRRRRLRRSARLCRRARLCRPDRRSDREERSEQAENLARRLLLASLPN